MPRSMTAEVEPAVVRWIRESAGWSVEETGKRLKVPAGTISEIEAGKRLPTLRQLDDMAAAFRFPFTSFFLSKPKPKKRLPSDYRFLQDRSKAFGKETVYAIRRSRYLQGLGAEMSKNTGRRTRPKVRRLGTGDSPEGAAARYRDAFGMSWDLQTGMKDAYGMFGYLRGKIEGLNILVFQFEMPVEDARGFVLADERPAVIVVNQSDGIAARAFTLMHELGHVLLGDTAVDMPDGSPSAGNGSERWCNAFASSFLLPRNRARAMFDRYAPHLTDTGTLDDMSKSCKVSKAAMLYAMLSMGYISKQRLATVLSRGTRAQGKSRKGGFQPPDQKCISRVGNGFISLVADNYDGKFITYSDALERLSVKTDAFKAIMSKAGA